MENTNHNMMEFTVQEVAQDVGKSAQQVRNYIRDGKVPDDGYKWIGRLLVINEAGRDVIRKLSVTQVPGRPKRKKIVEVAK